MPGIWIGTILSLAIAIALSRKAILIHQINSPFQIDYEEEMNASPSDLREAEEQLDKTKQNV